MSTRTEYAPRVRTEWVLAMTRVVVAAGVCGAVLAEQRFGDGLLISFVTYYLVYSVAVLALVWSPRRFGRGWAVALHAFDLVIFTAMIAMTRGASSPFFLTLVFLLLCASIRWQLRGTVWTAVAVVVAYAAASLARSDVLPGLSVAADPFVVRVVHLCVLATLLGYIGVYHGRTFAELSQIATWPRALEHKDDAGLRELLERASVLLAAPRVLLVWTEAAGERVTFATYAAGRMTLEQTPAEHVGTLVEPRLDGRTFQSQDAAAGNPHVVALARGNFARMRMSCIPEPLRARFDIRKVQSWPITGDVVTGRLYALDKRRMRLDDLWVGEIAARLVTSRLEGMYSLQRLEEATALAERVRLARDLHDSILQVQAGAAMQLGATRRLLDVDPSGARRALAEIQRQLEGSELEMRSLIRTLRPGEFRQPAPSLGARIAEMKRRAERQWALAVSCHVDADAERLPAPVAEQVYRLVNEAVVNAGRHAGASLVRVDVSATATGVRLVVADDGHGFPFTGTYDLSALTLDNRGPLTLRERITALRGDLVLRTDRDAGTELSMFVPLDAASVR